MRPLGHRRTSAGDIRSNVLSPIVFFVDEQRIPLNVCRWFVRIPCLQGCDEFDHQLAVQSVTAMGFSSLG